jgi:hypothetical protein
LMLLMVKKDLKRPISYGSKIYQLFNEKGSMGMHPIQPTVINVCFINDVKASSFIGDQIQYVYIMDVGIGDVQKGGDRGLHIV